MVASNFQASLKLVLQSEGGETVDRARRDLAYDPSSGKLVWLRDSKNRQRLTGDEAGCLNGSGYRRLKIGGKEFLAHRVAWALMTGSFPDLEVDHINGVRNDNRWCNLRLVDAAKQRANAKTNSNSSTGIRGVYFNKRRGKWRAHLQHRHLGYFDSIEDAKRAVERAFNEVFGAEYRRAA